MKYRKRLHIIIDIFLSMALIKICTTDVAVFLVLADTAIQGNLRNLQIEILYAIRHWLFPPQQGFQV